MQMNSRIVALAVAIVMIFSTLIGCSAVNNDPVIGKVGDIDITYSTYANALESVRQYYDYGAIEVENTENPMPELREKAFEQVVDSLIPVAIAHKRGVTLTAEDEATLVSMAKEQLQSAIDQATAELGEDVKEEAKLNYFEKIVKQNGYTMKQYEEMINKNVREQILADKMKAEAEATAVASEGIMKHWYEEEIKYEKQAYEKDLGAYYNATQYYDYITGVPPLYTPKGFVLIKQILIANPAEGEEKDIEAIAAEVQKKIDDGADFDELMAEYNEDPGAANNPSGYLFCEAIQSEYLPEFSEAASTLKEGETSAAVKTTEGIHFLRHMGEAPEMILPYEIIEEPLREYTLQTAKDELYQQALEDWRNEVEIVKDMKRIESIDKSNINRNA